MTHIFILGTAHSLQCGHSSVSASSLQAFEVELRGLIARHAVDRIAEEMSTDGLARYGVDATVAEKVARDLGLDHHHVDLAQAERESLGIHDGPLFTVRDLYHPSDSGRAFRDAMSVLEGEIRERVWTYRILARASSPVLFICGSEHVPTVKRIWHLLGLRCDVAHFDYADLKHQHDDQP